MARNAIAAVMKIMQFTHYNEIEDKDNIFWIGRISSQCSGIEPWVDHSGWYVCSIVEGDPFFMGQVDSLYLKKLDQVVEDREHDNGDDVAKTIPHLALLEREADSKKPLNSHRDNTVDTAWKCQRISNVTTLFLYKIRDCEFKKQPNIKNK